MAECLGLACEDLAFYTFKTVDTEGETLIVSRTGYTGVRMVLRCTAVMPTYKAHGTNSLPMA